MQLVVNTGKAKGRCIRVTGPHYVIGRSPECQLRPQSDQVSPRHAELKVIAGIVVISDLGSASGTRVNGQRLRGPASLRTGDRIEIGPLTLTALVDERRPSKRPRRATEDEIASWLVDEDEEADVKSASPEPRRTLESAAGETTRGRGGQPRSVPDRRPSEGARDDAAALLKAMMVHSD